MKQKCCVGTTVLGLLWPRPELSLDPPVNTVWIGEGILMSQAEMRQSLQILVASRVSTHLRVSAHPPFLSLRVYVIHKIASPYMCKCPPFFFWPVNFKRRWAFTWENTVSTYTQESVNSVCRDGTDMPYNYSNTNGSLENSAKTTVVRLCGYLIIIWS